MTFRCDFPKTNFNLKKVKLLSLRDYIKDDGLLEMSRQKKQIVSFSPRNLVGYFCAVSFPALIIEYNFLISESIQYQDGIQTPTSRRGPDDQPQG